jgi:hypothetical protein
MTVATFNRILRSNFSAFLQHPQLSDDLMTSLFPP